MIPLMKYKSLFNIITVIILCLYAIPLSALDTIETYPVGAFTDFEVYLSDARNKNSDTFGLELYLGGGFTENLSYYLTSIFEYSGTDRKVSTLGISLLWTPIQKDIYSIDLYPTLSANDSCSFKDFSYNDLDILSARLDIEINFTYLKKFQPFISAGTARLFDIKKDAASWMWQAGLGVMIPPADGYEIFFQTNLFYENFDNDVKYEKNAAAGLNIKFNESIEFITEAGWKFKAEEIKFITAVIFTI